jgi:hypothetical protein
MRSSETRALMNDSNEITLLPRLSAVASFHCSASCHCSRAQMLPESHTHAVKASSNRSCSWFKILDLRAIDRAQSCCASMRSAAAGHGRLNA